jgi:hypothetical protein
MYREAPRRLLGTGVGNMAMDTMRVTHTIPLEIQSPEYPGLVFLRAEINARQYAPFALVRYAISGIERIRALRLDLGKGLFIDLAKAEQGNVEFEKATLRLIATIVHRVSMEGLKWFASSQVSF